MRSCLKGLSVFAMVILVAGAIGWFARGFILTGFVELWTVEEVPQSADAVVVLGGGVDTRPFAAAEFYKQGLAALVLVSDVEIRPATKLGLKPSDTEIGRDVLLREGVPETAIQSFGKEVTSFWDEVNGLRTWADQNQPERILVPIEFIHTRRLRWALEQVFEGSEVEVIVLAIEPYEYSREAWWKNERGLITVQNEVIKYLYYRLKY